VKLKQNAVDTLYKDKSALLNPSISILPYDLLVQIIIATKQRKLIPVLRLDKIFEAWADSNSEKLSLNEQFLSDVNYNNFSSVPNFKEPSEYSVISIILGNKKKQSKVIVMGLEKSGKPTAILQLKHGSTQDKITPETDNYTETIDYSTREITMIEKSGDPSYPQIGELSSTEMDGIIFIVDSCDEARLIDAHSVLNKILESTDPNTPILVLANKQELPTAVHVVEIYRALELASICTGDGLLDALEWFMKKM
jgi:signal recognition particle receptor subunit beta